MQEKLTLIDVFSVQDRASLCKSLSADSGIGAGIGRCFEGMDGAQTYTEKTAALDRRDYRVHAAGRGARRCAGLAAEVGADYLEALTARNVVPLRAA